MSKITYIENVLQHYQNGRKLEISKFKFWSIPHFKQMIMGTWYLNEKEFRPIESVPLFDFFNQMYQIQQKKKIEFFSKNQNSTKNILKYNQNVPKPEISKVKSISKV